MTDATRNLLEQHFDTAFAAPGGIAKLRELILTLATRGKLVEQNPSDPPASQLLKEIEAEKQRLVKAKKIKKPKPLPPIKPEEVPYELPEGWEWVRLGDIGVINPRNDAQDSTIAGFVPMPMIPEGYSDNHRFEERLWSEIKKGYTHFANGDVGMAKITPCFENSKSCVFSGLPNGIGAGTTELHIFRNTFNSVVPRFLLYHLKNPHYISKAVSNMTGSAGQKRVPTPYFAEQLFPLPPLPEQHRIVARIDQLMARCDEMEKLRTKREKTRLAVHAAAVKQLLDAPGGSAWEFIQQRFGELYTVKENVAELRKAIIQLAVMGRLVPQNPDDPPASELLKEIEAEKQRLVNAKKIKKPKPLPPIKPEEVPYELPQGWEWVRFEDIVEIGSGITKGRKLEGRKLISIPYLRVANVQRSYLNLAEIKEIEIPVEEAEKYLLVRGDLLITEGGDWDKVGRTCIWMEEIPICGHQNHVFRARKLLMKQNESWLERYLNSPTARDYFAGASKQTTNLASINKTQLRGCPIPLPPLSEQHRIVARLHQLMGLCDRLEQDIDAATGKQDELLGAVMAQA
jgi:type I restriction enzyme S subunit